MPIRPHYLPDVKALANVQLGVVTTQQMRSAGVPPSTISRWSKPGGHLRRLLPATYVWGFQPVTQAQREMAAMAYVNFDGRITGVVALAQYGVRDLPVDLEDAPVHVLISDRRAISSSGFVIVERTKRLPKPIVVANHPLAPPARALFDAGRQHHQEWRGVRATVLECLRSGLVTPSELNDEIAGGQRRWTAALRAAHADFEGGVVSVPEAEVRDDLAAAGLTSFVWNADLYTRAGDFLGRPDGYDRESGLALEVDSRRHHSVGDDWSRTLERNARYATVGIVVFSIVPARLRSHRAELVAQVKQARQALLGRPIPPVLVKCRDGRIIDASASPMR